ncbi:hypothetical protein ACFFLG_19220 [Shewanella indica]|uniref:hypothetical protein n=1 Tax=Shewanella indica TaxID=768528 RepID=UPI000C3292FB|nr:hypothetical protein [Shewanella indica]
MAYSVIPYQTSFVLVLHPAARRAYDAMQSIPVICDLQQLPGKVLQEWASQTIHCIEQLPLTPLPQGAKKRPRIFQYYSPLWAAKYWQDGHPPTGTLIVFQVDPKKQPSDKEVENKAWLSLLQMLSLSISPKNAAVFIDAWRQGLPMGFIEEIFQRKTISDQFFCDLLSMTRGALIQQRQRLVTSIYPTESPNPIDELLKPWEPNP